MKWKKLVNEADVKISDIADFAGVSYFTMAQMLEEEIEMSAEVRNAVKIFLLQNYTKRIVSM